MMKALNNKAYVLVETIVVISVLCVLLITLFGAYSSMIISVERKNFYDNTDYLYRTKYIRDYLENIIKKEEYNSDVERIVFEDKKNRLLNEKLYCQNDNNPCYVDDCNGDSECELFKFFDVIGVYIFDWNSEKIKFLSGIHASTLKYVNSLDASNIEGASRLVVMYEYRENGIKKNEYASLKMDIQR